MPRPAFLPATVSLAVQPARFEAFLAAHRAPAYLLVLARAAGLPFARALFADPLEDGLADACDRLALFSTPPLDTRWSKRPTRGRSSSARLGGCPRGTSPRTSHRVRERAGAPDARGGPSRGPGAGRAPGAAVRVRVRRRGVAPRPPGGRGRARPPRVPGERTAWSEVWSREDPRSGTIDLALLSSGELEVAVEVDPSVGPRAHAYAPLRSDRLRIDVAGGRISLWTLHPHEARALADGVGQAFFGDPAFFTDRPALTSKTLEALGSAGLAQVRLPAPLTRWRVIACTREVIGVGRQLATGSRALALQEEGGTMDGGYLTEVTFRFDVAGEETPVDVEIRLPGRFACSAPRWEALVREAMASIGMMAPGSLGDDAWSLFPVRRPEWRVREVLGPRGVDPLLAEKVLRRVLSRNVTTEALRAQGSNFLTFAVPGEPGVSYAVSGDPSVASRDATERDREVLELDAAKLAALRAREMKLEGASRVLSHGALLHGALRARDTELAFVSLLRPPGGPAEREALSRELAREVFPAHLVLLVPRGRSWVGGALQVEFDGLVEGGTALVERAVKLAGVEDDVDPCRLTNAPLVVHRKTRRVWFHQTLMDLPDSGYTMIEGLALRPTEITPSRDVCKWLSPSREDLQAARATRPKIVKWMAASFEGAGKTVPLEEIEGVIVVEGKRGYRLGVEVKVFS